MKNQKPATYVESLVARYFIEKNKKSINKNIQGAKDPCCFSSISHKEKLVFIATSDKKIWIDIEILKIRDENLLNKFTDSEYKILEQAAEDLCWKDNLWNKFYILWTAKESCIKLLDITLDEIEEILLTQVEFWDYLIDWLEFFTKSTYCYKWKNMTVYSWKDWDIFYSVAYYFSISFMS